MRTLISFVPLLAWSALLSAVRAAHVAAGAVPSAGLELIASLGVGLFIILWMIFDARRRRRVPCFDFGFLMGVLLPVSLIWYAFWSRGWRGIGPLLAVFGLAILPGIVEAIVWGVVS